MCVREPTVSLTHTWGVGSDGLFSSRCLSGVPGLLCCGCSYSQRMNRINENSLLLLKPAGGTRAVGACKHGELQRKAADTDVICTPAAFHIRGCTAIKKKVIFFSLSSGVQELLVSLSSTKNTHLISQL